MDEVGARAQPDRAVRLQGEVAQLRANVRPARASDFMYLDTLAPVCARCRWTNDAVMAERERRHAEERGYRAELAERGLDAFGRPIGGARG